MALLNTQIKVPLTQNQCDALCSLVFNIGATAFAASTLLKKLNFGDYSGAAAEFIKWNKATVNDKKIPLLGLIKRRQVEKALFELA